MNKLDTLERYFGYTAFRPGQEELIDGILAGRDVFGIMPTGGGKSLCYQVPAMLLPGITLVISPLISLMQDQVMALKENGIPAAFINSTLNYSQTQRVYQNLLCGRYKLVYVAPERLDQPGFLELTAQLPISLVAVDEAHCISQWGQDFRPSYLRIVQFIATVPRRPVVAAFTATATEQVRLDVERILGLQNPISLVTGFDRPNLSFSVRKPKDKDGEILSLVMDKKDKCGIIYCSTRKNVEQVCQLLQDNGYAATRYHAGLEESERTENQDDFLYDRKTIMVATNAFGMGIDKSNVNFVYHYNMPKSLEAYYQEAGRAGRDGTEAECVLLFAPRDVEIARFLIEKESENEELDEAQRAMVREQDLVRLEAMAGYCKTRECLRGHILSYFGQKHPTVCGNCGNCLGDYELVDVTRQAQMILSCIWRVREKLGYSVGADMISKVLRGSKEKRLTDMGLQNLSTYNLMQGSGNTEVRELIDLLELEGYVQTEQEHRTLQLTAKARDILFTGQQLKKKTRKEELKPIPASTREATRPLNGTEKDLFEALRELRASIARERQLPAYMIFSDATLRDMAVRVPVNLTEFRRVSGVGQTKTTWYGQQFVERIREFVSQQN